MEYKIIRYSNSGFICEKSKYLNFKEAKAAMHKTIVTKMNGMQSYCNELIDSYCKEYYPDSNTDIFELLKQFINDYLTNPAELDKTYDEKYKDLEFEDDRIAFGFDFGFDGGPVYAFFIDVQEEANCKFPKAFISTIKMSPITLPDAERGISLSAGEDIGLDIVLSQLTDEDDIDAYEED